MPKGKRGRKLFLISLSRRSLPLFKLNHHLRLRHRHDKTTDRVLAGTPQTIDVTRQGRTKLLRHERRGTLSASGSPSAVGSQFFLTLSADLDSLDGKHAAFGVVAEGLEVLDAIGEAAVDAGGVPLQNIRIKHTLVLENPFLNDGGNEGGEVRFICRDASPPSQGPFGDNGRLEDNWRPAAKEEDKKNKKKRKKKEDGDDESDGGGDDDDSGEENSGDDDEVASIAAAAARRREGAAARAVVLEMVGDLPAADVAPPGDGPLRLQAEPRHPRAGPRGRLWPLRPGRLVRRRQGRRRVPGIRLRRLRDAGRGRERLPEDEQRVVG